MIAFPMGLESRFKKIPLATLGVVLVTIFYSLNNLNPTEVLENLKYKSQASHTYVQNAKGYVLKTCIKEEKNFCNDITKISEIYFIDVVVQDSMEQVNEKTKIYALDYIQSQTKEDVLKLKNPSLYQEQISLKNQIQSYIKTNDLLNKDNIQTASLIKSLLLHTEYLYLAANMILLILLGAYVEARVGFIGILSIYFLTGMLGAGFNVFYNKDIEILIGSSNAVAGVLGAFTFFFWKHQAKFIVTNVFTFSKFIFIPIYFFIPVFYLASNIEALMGVNSQMSYLAHLIGFLGGIVLAYSINIQMPLPKFYSFLYEKDYSNNVSKTNWILGKFNIYKKWIQDVPQNIYVFERLVDLKAQMDETFTKDKNYVEFLEKDLNTIYTLNKLKVDFITKIPLSWMAYLKINADEKFLIKIYTKLVVQKDEVGSFKLSYLILKELNWSSQEWEQAFMAHFLSLKKDQQFAYEIQRLVELDIQARDCLSKVESENQSA